MNDVNNSCRMLHIRLLLRHFPHRAQINVPIVVKTQPLAFRLFRLNCPTRPLFPFFPLSSHHTPPSLFLSVWVSRYSLASTCLLTESRKQPDNIKIYWEDTIIVIERDSNSKFFILQFQLAWKKKKCNIHDQNYIVQKSQQQIFFILT